LFKNIFAAVTGRDYFTVVVWHGFDQVNIVKEAAKAVADYHTYEVQVCYISPSQLLDVILFYFNPAP
jgi:hypothetical protein